MDNMAYLQQISTSSKPAGAKGKFSFKNLKFNPLILAIIGGVIILIIIIMVVASMLNTVDEKDKDLSYQAELRITNLITVIDDFGKYLKNSSLRSMGSTLKNVLTETDNELLKVIQNDFGLKKNALKKLPVATDETALYAELNNTLEDARISGYLDRVYTREFTLEIARLMSIQSEIVERTENTTLKDALTKSNTDLQSLHTQFSEYSDYSN